MPSPASTAATDWPRILFLWICGIFAAMQFSKIALAFLVLQQTYGVSAAAVGLLLSMVGLVGLVCGVTVGLTAPAIGYRRLLLAGLGLGAVLSFLQSLMPPFGWLLATRALEGAAHLAIVVAAPTLIAASAGPRQRSVAMGLWSTFMGVGFAVTAALGAGILVRHGVSGLLRLHAGGMAVMLLAAWRILPPDASAEFARPWPRLAALPAYHREIYARLHTALPGLCFFCYTTMAVALLTFLPGQAGEGHAWLAVVLPFTGIAGSFCAGWLAQYWVSALLLVRLAFAGVGMAGAAFWLCAHAGMDLAAVALALMFLAGLAGGAAFALIPYLSDDSELHARANGAVAQMGNVGSTLGPPLYAGLIAPLGALGLALPVVLAAAGGIALAQRGARRLAGTPDSRPS